MEKDEAMLPESERQKGGSDATSGRWDGKLPADDMICRMHRNNPIL